ncbi:MULTISPECIES: AEC family transporter [Vibrio]|uniref:AEC family transporter n=1 Tax=Vibrio algicola TaxID=2662262 RepID=A0A5Q0TJ68_9VIBR|nr:MULTISPECIES: AEC family transporter [Vibrio]MBD1577658.1 AEC family transporter [Vibrio sp. S11_S32]
MNELIQHFAFSASITGPICLMILLGVVLRRFEVINDNFIDVASKLVFKVTLPAMLFLSIINSTSIGTESIPLVMFGVISNTLFFLFTAFTVRFFIKDPSQKGVVVQGGFRANTAIIALAYVANAYGETGVAIAAVYVASLTMLYNILAVIALTPKGENSNAKAYLGMIKSMAKNPLILSILLALIVYTLSIPVPEIITHAGQYFANMTLPLALLCTGGSLNIRELKHDRFPNIIATGYKLILAPLFITITAYYFGFNNQELGIIFFMSAAPTAAASYVMARSMGGSATLAANIIALTTIGSIVTCSLGIMLLSSLNLM